MDAKELRKLNNYQNALKKNFMAGKQAIEYSLDIIDTIDDLYKDNYKNLEKRNFFRFFYPLEMLVDVAQNIEAKSKILLS